MTDELTLREKVDKAMVDFSSDIYMDVEVEHPSNIIATILEDTGSPAHMRVAAELRGLDDA